MAFEGAPIGTSVSAKLTEGDAPIAQSSGGKYSGITITQNNNFTNAPDPAATSDQLISLTKYGMAFG
jgi:hypothetical protein